MKFHLSCRRFTVAVTTGEDRRGEPDRVYPAPIDTGLIDNTSGSAELADVDEAQIIEPVFGFGPR